MRKQTTALLLAITLACGASGHWVARPGADQYAEGRCEAQAESATDTYSCEGLSACITENVRWSNIYDACMRGSGYVWVEDPKKPATPKKETAACTGSDCW